MMYEYYLESKGKKARRKRTDDRYLLATLLNLSNQDPVEKHCRLPATMPTSKKADVVPRHRACMLAGAVPPSFVSYFAYQTFLQTQRARRMTASVRAAGKAGRRRGTRARDGQPRYLLKKRRHGTPPEMSRLHIQAPTPSGSITPPNASVFSPSSSSSCSTSSTSSTVCSPTSPATWQLSPLSDVGPALEVPIAAPSEPESPSPTKSSGAKKKYPCDLCDKSFDYKHVLQNHNRTHTGEKPYQCPQCHKRFTRDHHLKTHIRLHTGEKPFGCAVCHKRFVQVANLRRHERVHAGERQHRCGHSHCDAALSDCDRPTTPDAKPSDCALHSSQSRRKRHKSGSGIVTADLRFDKSSTASSMASAVFSTGGTLASGVAAGASASSMSSAADLSFDTQLREDGDKCPVDEDTGGGDGCLTMDVGFRVIRNNRYHQRQLGRRHETWPHLHRLSQPYQEQPEDLSVKK